MKQLWQKVDDVMNKQQSMNESLIKRILQERNTGSLKRLANMEYAGLFTGIILMAVLLPQVGFVTDNAGILVCFILANLCSLIVVVFSWYKIKYLSAMDASVETVSDLAEKTARYHKIITQERIVMLALGPAIIGIYYVVVNYLVRGVNILDNITPYLLRFIVATIIYIIASVLLYNKYYFKQLQEINKNLREIAEFKG